MAANNPMGIDKEQVGAFLLFNSSLLIMEQ